MTKLCCSNRDKPDFSAFERYAELAASELSPLRRIIGPKLARFEPDVLSYMGHLLDKYRELQPKRKTTDELKVALQTIWEELSTRGWQTSQSG